MKTRKPYPKQRLARGPKDIKRNCGICNKVSLFTKRQISVGKGKYCSKSCSNIAVGLKFKGKTHGNLPKGKDHHNWKGDTNKTKCLICENRVKIRTRYNIVSKCCSVKCRDIYTSNSQRGKIRVEPKKCLNCEKLYHEKATYIEGKTKPTISQRGKMFCSRKCSFLSKNKGTQIKIFKAINKEGFDAEMEKSFYWLINPKTKRKLWIDIFVPSLNLAIEYDGPQHYEIGVFCKTEKDLQSIMYRDAIKESLVKKNKINFIRLRGRVNFKELIDNIKSMQVENG